MAFKDVLRGQDDVSCCVQDGVALVKIELQNAFEGMTSLETSGNLFALYDALEKDDDIRVVLIINESGSFGEEAYRRFLADFSGQDMNQFSLKNIVEYEKKLIRAREINLLQRFILRQVEYSKVMIMAMHGQVVTPFFGMSLATDLRFAAEDMEYSLKHVDYGLHPSGALAFFLQKYVGQGKAAEMLLKGGSIPAVTALKMGLINSVYPKGDFEDRCIHEAKKIAKLDPNVAATTRRLSYHFKKELKSYFAVELEFVDF